MITVSGLAKSYGLQTIFDNVSFTVGPGERVGLVGRNGSGKTTLFRLILGEEEPDEGSIHISKGYSVGHLSQHISFQHRTVLEEAAADLKADEEGADTTYKAKEILLGLGFTFADFSRNPHELSGGYQIRLNFARLLASKPELILLDEPTNYLDILSVRWLTKFLREWQHELMLITHDRTFMDSVTSHTMAIHRNKLRKLEGGTEKLYQQIVQDEEVYEQTRLNEEKKRNEIEQFINRFRAKAAKARAVQSRIRALRKKGRLVKMTEERNLDFEFRSAPFHGKWLLEATNLVFSFDRAGPPLIDMISLVIGKKDRVGVIGKNGKGKTTLLNLLAGELTPLAGSIIRHENLSMGYFGQTNIARLNPLHAVEEEIGSVFHEGGYGSIRSVCGAMMFEGENALKKVSVLSGGEKSRVLLGKIIVSPANLLILDEPTNHLDMESIDSLIEAIDAFNGAVVIATHSEMILQAIVTKLVVFDRGTVSCFDGSYQDFLDRVGWEDEDSSGKGPVRIGKGREKNVDKKELRRIRAELINDRSRTLTPLKERIDRLERSIIRMEQQMEEENRLLLKASQAGNGKAIGSLSMSIHNTKREIDLSFEELESVSVEHHEKARVFEEKLRDLDRLDDAG